MIMLIILIMWLTDFYTIKVIKKIAQNRWECLYDFFKMETYKTILIIIVN